MEAFADADISNKNIDTKQKYRDNIDTTFRIDMHLYGSVQSCCQSGGQFHLVSAMSSIVMFCDDQGF